MKCARFLLVPTLVPVFLSLAAVDKSALAAGQEDHMRQVNVYLVDVEGQLLRPITTSIFVGKSISLQAKQVIEIASRDPQDASLFSAIPPGTYVRELYVDTRGLAYVDLSSDFVTSQSGGSLGEFLAVYAIVNSLTVNFEEISYVQLLIEGRQVTSSTGHVDILHPLCFDGQWVAAADSQQNQY